MRFRLSGFQLKLLAIFSMTIDHIGAVLLTGTAAMVCRAMGRLAFPIFCFLLVEGCCHTKNVKKYLLRLAAFALFCEPIYDWTFYRQLSYWHDQNIFLTLFLGLALLTALDQADKKTSDFSPKKRRVVRSLIWVVLFDAVAAVSVVVRADYSVTGIAVIAAFYLLRGKPLWRDCALVLIMICNFGVYREPLQLFAVFALIPISIYSGKRGARFKYGFYFYYPAHLLLISALVVAPLFGVGVVTQENYRAAYKQEDGFSSQSAELSPGTPELVNAIIHGGGLFKDDISWDTGTSSLLVEPETQIDETSSYPDIFVSNGCFALLVQGAGRGWKLSAGDTVTCSFAVDLDKQSTNRRELGGFTIGFYPVRDGVCVAEESIKQSGEQFAFSYTAPSEGIYYFGLSNFSSDKFVTDGLEVIREPLPL